MFGPIKRGNSKLANEMKRPSTPSTIFKCRNKFSELSPTVSLVLPIPAANPYLQERWDKKATSYKRARGEPRESRTEPRGLPLRN